MTHECPCSIHNFDLRQRIVIGLEDTFENVRNSPQIILFAEKSKSGGRWICNPLQGQWMGGNEVTSGCRNINWSWCLCCVVFKKTFFYQVICNYLTWSYTKKIKIMKLLDIVIFATKLLSLLSLSSLLSFWLFVCLLTYLI